MSPENLRPSEDFLLGTPQRVFHDIDELVEVVQANINERMNVCHSAWDVANVAPGHVRLVMFGSTWFQGKEGSCMILEVDSRQVRYFRVLHDCKGPKYPKYHGESSIQWVFPLFWGKVRSLETKPALVRAFIIGKMVWDGTLAV